MLLQDLLQKSMQKKIKYHFKKFKPGFAVEEYAKQCDLQFTAEV